jgi:ubiquinone/menaquinone biosynthesis C-methylase UbiE
MNYFVHQTAAERYAQGRPYFHPLVVGKIRNYLNLCGPVPRAVDVACGTGQSAVALAEIASEVVAADIASAMLAQAPVHARIRYIEAPAEQLPLESQTVDLITVSLAFHWFDRSRFLTEAHRLLRSGGWLVIYTNGFFGRMNGNPDFERWNRESYVTRYPTPPRNNQHFTDEDARSYGFAFSARENYTNEIAFSAEQLACYLMTQSNVIAAVEQGSESPESVYSWLLDSVTPFFGAATATFPFGGEIWYLRANVR